MIHWRSVSALLRAGFRTAASYRLRFVFSLASVVVTVVPIFFVSRALQPMMQTSIQGEGREYFAFLLLGFVTLGWIQVSAEALPNQVSGDIGNGFFEALIGSPAGTPAVLVGLAAYPVVFALARGVLSLALGVALGLKLEWAQLPAAALVVTVLLLAHFGVALLATAAVVAFRTTFSLPQLFIAASALLGGVYWPTSVIPSWLQSVSDWFPVAYGLRALRRLVLEGQSLASVRQDLTILVAFSGLLLTLGAIALATALAQARARGSLSQY